MIRKMLLGLIGLMLVATPVMAKDVSVTLGGSGDFSSPILLQGAFNVSVTATTWVGNTITLQRSFDSGATWKDVWSTTSNMESSTEYEPEVKVSYRIGFKSGQYGSGTAAVRISQ